MATTIRKRTRGQNSAGLLIAALALLAFNHPATASTPTCNSPLSDADGDGWGWENNQTCAVIAVPNHEQWPACFYASSDADGDGYGWENSQSCVVGTARRPAANVTYPICSQADSDADGDGWGWEDGQSCRTTSTGAPPTDAAAPGPALDRPACTSTASDPDGDGWGWENGQSCRINESDIPPIGAATGPDTDTPTCGSSASDLDGDGWGWENGQSCRINESDIPPIGAATGPDTDTPTCSSGVSDLDGDGWGWENGQSCRVSDTHASGESGGDNGGDADNGNGTDSSSGLPVCLSTASDPLGSGYGYEFGQSCKVVAGVSNTADDPLYNTEFCSSWAELAYGNYRLQNNTWNAREVYSDNWSQCIELEQNSQGDTVAVWRFDWLGKYEGDQAEVKSYPQVYYGRKNQWNFSGTPEEIGLPRPLDSLDRFTVDYAFTTRGNAEYNVALESFFHTNCNASERNKQFELMVWVGIPGEKTPGTQVTTATIDGVEWKVYANPALSWGYVAFVAPETTPSGRLDWNAFIDWSRANAPGLGLGTLENTCMGAIEIGTETFWGELEFRLDRFDVTRR
jgi:hypothetical protein